MRKVEVIERRTLFDDFFKVEEAKLRYECHDGRMSEPVRRLNFERSDSAAALVVNTERRTVYLAEQFRFPALDKAGGWLVELVAGMIDDGESPAGCIKREIQEETGFEVEAVEPIGEFFVSPGGTSERVFLFLAEVSDAARKSQGGGLVSENENIQVLEWTIDEFLAKAQSGQLKDAKTIIAAYWLRQNLSRIAQR